MRSTPPRASKDTNDDYTPSRDTRQLSSGERGVLRQLVAQYNTRPELAGPMLACLEASWKIFSTGHRTAISWRRTIWGDSPADMWRSPWRFSRSSIAWPRPAFSDIGSGAGFPAIPIQILRPELTVTVVESRRRKGLFLKRVVEGLELQKTTVIVGRAENLGSDGAGPFDVATARAVAVIGELLPWLSPVIRPGGHAILFKGSSHPEELEAWSKHRGPALEARRDGARSPTATCTSSCSSARPTSPAGQD